jgi:hypothetical protein
MEISWARVEVGLENAGRFFARMFPPNFERSELLVKGLLESLQIAVLATALGIVLALPIGFAAIFDHSLEGKPDLPAGREHPGAAIPEKIGVIGEGHVWFDLQLLWGAQIGLARGMHEQHQNHRGRALELKFDIESDLDQHFVRRRIKSSAF